MIWMKSCISCLVIWLKCCTCCLVCDWNALVVWFKCSTSCLVILLKCSTSCLMIWLKCSVSRFMIVMVLWLVAQHFIHLYIRRALRQIHLSGPDFRSQISHLPISLTKPGDPGDNTQSYRSGCNNLPDFYINQLPGNVCLCAGQNQPRRSIYPSHGGETSFRNLFQIPTGTNVLPGKGSQFKISI